MLSWRLQTGPEKAELQELNARLYDYVCRVRELERENLLLEEELRGRRGQESLWAAGQARYTEEARSLRQQLDELGWATALAEGERDALRSELRELQRLGAEARAARGRLDAELGAQRRELQEALGARAALEELLGRLQAERLGLDAAHEREVRELRARAASLTVRYRARAAAPPPRLREVHDSYALLVAESWRETVQLYEDEVRELEEALRRGQESRREAEEETRLCALEAEALRREAHELEELRARLEDELLRMREEYELQAEERQRVIDCLEDEKAGLTLTIADRLRDYQDLVQVKTGLSLEVATYRALLEGESNPEILVWTEHVENMPQDFRTYQYANSILQSENERNLFPRQKAPAASFNRSSTLYSNLSTHLGSQTAKSLGSAASRGLLGSEYSSSASSRQENSYQKTVNNQTRSRTFSPVYGLLRNTEAPAETFPNRPKTEGKIDATTYLAKDSTVAQESSRERRDNVAVGVSKSARPNERTIILENKTEAKATREQGRNISGTVKTKQEEKMFDSKEKASEERNLRWEEMTKLDKEARERESQQMKEKAKGKEPLREKTTKEREIPISLEVSRDSTPEVAPKSAQTPVKKDAGDGAETGTGTREMRFKLDASAAASSLKGDSMTETVAENIVSSILKQFTQSPDGDTLEAYFPDTKVTYMDRKELPGDRKTKTEIIVESKMTEDIDVSDEAGLKYLLSKNTKEVELKGKSAERMLGDIINLGLQGREGRAKVVNVEIIEEPVSYVGGEEAVEPSTPFEVEEVDDVPLSSKGLVEEEDGDGEMGRMFSVSQGKRTKQPHQHITHVEEVTEAGDSEGEQSYFVSTPDESSGGHDRDEGSVYGQIHIEEESTIKYSWQDEIVQGTWKGRRRDDGLGEKVVKPLDIPAPSPEGDVDASPWKVRVTSGEFHAEPTVTEKEIKIPHEFHTSIKEAFSKEPRRQLVEVIGQLEESLPERVKEELSALTKEDQGEPGSISVDVKKVQTPDGGSVTLVAEVNLSQTVDADQLDLEELSRDEAGEIEKAVESVVRESLAKRHGQAPESPDREDGGGAPAGGFRFKRWATRELYSPSGEKDEARGASLSVEHVASQGPVSATVEISSPRGFAQSQVLEDVSQSVRHIKMGPTEIWRTEQVSPKGPTSEVVEVSGEGGLDQTESSVGASWSVRHFTLGPNQSQTSQEVIFQGPVSAFEEEGATEEPGQTEFPTDTDKSGQHITLGSKQFHAKKEIIFQGPISRAGKVGENFQTEESVGTHTSVRHLKLDPKEGLSEQIQFTVPLSDKMELGIRGDSAHTEESSGIATSVRHIKIGPREHQITEQIVFHGSVPHPEESSDSESTVHREGSTDMTQATRSYTLGKETLMTEKSTFQRVVSASSQEDSAGATSGAEVTADISRSFRHIRLGPTETGTSEHIVFCGPISTASALAGSGDSPGLGEVDSSTSFRHISLGPKETSFTFQMDVSNGGEIPGSARWTREAAVLFPGGNEAESHGVSDSGTGRDAGNRNDQAAGVSSQASAGAGHQAHGEKGQERAMFDKTVQLQRMVDQRSVVSDEKKVALLYLDHEEEDSDGHWF